MINEANFRVILQTAIKHCSEGKTSEELRLLYNSPYRDQVPWELFPQWARIDMETEMQHEG